MHVTDGKEVYYSQADLVRESGIPFGSLHRDLKTGILPIGFPERTVNGGRHRYWTSSEYKIILKAAKEIIEARAKLKKRFK